MPTAYTATQTGAADTVPGVGDGHAVKAICGVFALTAALAAGDTISTPNLPNGATVLDVILSTSDLDTNGTPTITFDVGDAAVSNRYIAASNVGQAGGVARMNQPAAAPFTLTSKGPVVAKVNAGPATGATTGTVAVTVIFLPPFA